MWGLKNIRHGWLRFPCDIDGEIDRCGMTRVVISDKTYARILGEDKIVLQEDVSLFPSEEEAEKRQSLLAESKAEEGNYLLLHFHADWDSCSGKHVSGCAVFDKTQTNADEKLRWLQQQIEQVLHNTPDMLDVLQLAPNALIKDAREHRILAFCID